MGYKCDRCPGYCCSHPRIAVTNHDIARLARHFGITSEMARKRHTYTSSAEGVAAEQILRHQKDSIYASVCKFFGRESRRCTVYAARPNVCRRYPYGSTCGYYDFLNFERDFHDDSDFVPLT